MHLQFQSPLHSIRFEFLPCVPIHLAVTAHAGGVTLARITPDTIRHRSICCDWDTISDASKHPRADRSLLHWALSYQQLEGKESEADNLGSLVTHNQPNTR